jgi:glycosyltransferase involved in cell wall biosynthesis
MSVDVSVVVPFFNPGANIDDCLASLVQQSLPAAQFETILIDDGSTDGSDARVRDWLQRHPGRFTLRRIEASGGPARPRNVGIDMARGRYIQFLDSDDTLAPNALERQLTLADESDAEVVVGKLASDFRGIWHPLFRQTVTGKTLATYPLIQNLTVCKMFRRDFLIEHDVRFPEGPHYIEDQQICIKAYAHARSVAVVSDTVCYHYRRRRVGGRNFGDTTIEPAAYFRELGAIFDIIDTEVEAAARDTSLARYYRGEVLGRLRGPAMLQYDATYRQRLHEEARRIAADRIPAPVRDTLPVFTRLQSRLLLDDDLDGLLELARWMETFRLRASGDVVGWHDGRLQIDVDAALHHNEELLQLEPVGGGWAVPEAAAPGTDTATRQWDDLTSADVDLATIARIDSQLWSTTAGLALTVDESGVPRVRCRVEIDPDHVMGGSRLSGGLWDLRLRVMVGGLTRTSPLRATTEHPPRPPAWLSGSTTSVQPYWTDPAPTLALDVDEWMHRLGDRVAGATCHIEGRRQLVVDLPRVTGPSTSARPVSVVLEPLDTDGPLLNCTGELRGGPDVAVITAALPALPADSGSWAVWLRAGDPGSGALTRLDVTVSPGRLRRVVLGVPAPSTD